MVTLSIGHLRFRPECVVILGVQGLHGLMLGGGGMGGLYCFLHA